MREELRVGPFGVDDDHIGLQVLNVFVQRTRCTAPAEDAMTCRCKRAQQHARALVAAFDEQYAKRLETDR